MTQHLLQRGHTWYVRYVVPRASRSKLGKESIFRSLKTRDLDVARKRKHAVLAEIMAEIEVVMNGGKPSKAAMIEEATAFAEEIRTAPTEEKAELAEYVASDRADYFHRKVSNEAGQLYTEVALRGSMPITGAGEKYLASIVGKVTAGTVDGRKRSIDLFVQNMGDMPISKLSPRIAASWMSNHLEPSGKAPATIGRYLDTMNLLWDWSFRREWCAGGSPFKGLKSELPPKEKKKRGFTNEELQVYLDFLKKRPKHKSIEYEVALLLAFSSTRLGDICELRVRHIFNEGTEAHIYEGKNESASRVLFFSHPKCVEILNRRIEGKQPDDQVFEELVVGGVDGKLNHALSNRMRRYLSEAIPTAQKLGLDVHSIRRWAATVLENTPEIDMTLSMRLFGHKTGKMLTDVYSNGPERQRLQEGFKLYSEAVEERLDIS
ncbi:MAG: hypothetical protein JKY12_06585 [Sneathiella sp.]|nr:hypothetical protein [Sneathiella sp.]